MTRFQSTHPGRMTSYSWKMTRPSLRSLYRWLTYGDTPIEFIQLRYTAQHNSFITSMSVRFIVGPKCTLTSSHAVPWWVAASMPTRQTDGQTDGRQTVKLRFPLDAVSVTTVVVCIITVRYFKTRKSSFEFASTTLAAKELDKGQKYYTSCSNVHPQPKNWAFFMTFDPWPRTSNLTRYRVKMKQQSNYLRQMSLSTKVLVWTYRQTHTPDKMLYRTTKINVNNEMGS